MTDPSDGSVQCDNCDDYIRHEQTKTVPWANVRFCSYTCRDAWAKTNIHHRLR